MGRKKKAQTTTPPPQPPPPQPPSSLSSSQRPSELSVSLNNFPPLSQPTTSSSNQQAHLKIVLPKNDPISIVLETLSRQLQEAQVEISRLRDTKLTFSAEIDQLIQQNESAQKQFDVKLKSAQDQFDAKLKIAREQHESTLRRLESIQGDLKKTLEELADSRHINAQYLSALQALQARNETFEKELQARQETFEKEMLEARREVDEHRAFKKLCEEEKAKNELLNAYNILGSWVSELYEFVALEFPKPYDGDWERLQKDLRNARKRRDAALVQRLENIVQDAFKKLGFNPAAQTSILEFKQARNDTVHPGLVYADASRALSLLPPTHGHLVPALSQYIEFIRKNSDSIVQSSSN